MATKRNLLDLDFLMSFFRAPTSAWIFSWVFGIPPCSSLSSTVSLAAFFAFLIHEGLWQLVLTKARVQNTHLAYYS